jgi:hypothetical protein
VERVDVLQNVGLAVRDENHVQLVERLVHESDIILLDGRVLSAAIGVLGERGEESFDARARHLPELPRKDSFPPAGTDRSREDNLGAQVS